MKTITIPATLAAVLSVLLMPMAGCSDRPTAASHGVIQTKYPGQVSAGGRTSGQVLTANARPETDATYAGGTPGIAGGAGGNTSGAALGGTVVESGQGPSSGVTAPSSAGRPGAELQAGDTGGATAPSPHLENAPASNAAAQGPAAGGRLEGKQ